MASGFTLSGGSVFKKRLEAAKSKTPEALKAATKESLILLEAAAKRILEAEIAAHGSDHADSPLRQNQHDSIFKSFVHQFASVGADAVSASLVNTSGHAKFVEQGTDNEGTGSHFVPVISGFALAWFDAATGEMAFSKEGIEVKGIKPYRFMERALFENRAQVIAIYQKHAKRILH